MRVIHGAVAVCAMLVFGHAPASADSRLVLTNMGTGQCLDVAGNSTWDGARVTQWTCHGAENQQFEFVWVDNDYFALRAVHSGKCVDLLGRAIQDEGPVVQRTCDGGDSQLWSLPPTEPDGWVIRNRESGNCLDVFGDRPGASVVQVSCAPVATQHWKVRI